ncbi:response regulator transcription factor [Clostridium oceanicum]|uniref:Stage 0 sporulation protein A homolog n=1 Tax=Clostridium oceanicum TaxID=1543 RepID=A0ABP3UM67_9CLOT
MNILLIDDHALFVKSLEFALEDYDEIENFYTIKDIDKVMEVISKKNLDIILIDINLNNMTSKNGLEIAKDIVAIYPEKKIVILTGYDLPVYRYEAKKIGVKGFLNKNITPDKLFKLLIHINKGNSFFEGNVNFIEVLTKNEKQILQLLAEGYKRKNIAKLLHLSERTISNHIQNIFSKLNVTSSIEAVTKGIQLGYVQPIY